MEIDKVLHNVARTGPHCVMHVEPAAELLSIRRPADWANLLYVRSQHYQTSLLDNLQRMRGGRTIALIRTEPVAFAPSLQHSAFMALWSLASQARLPNTRCEREPGKRANPCHRPSPRRALAAVVGQRALALDFCAGRSHRFVIANVQGDPRCQAQPRGNFRNFMEADCGSAAGVVGGARSGRTSDRLIHRGTGQRAPPLKGRIARHRTRARRTP